MTRKILSGLLAGFCAAIPMGIAMMLGRRFLPRRQRYALPPRQITMRIADRLRMRTRMSEPQRQAGTILAHVGYGALMGFFYAAIAPARWLGAATGMAYGILVWAGSYFGLMPALRILPSAAKWPASRNWLMAGAHVVWGAILGETASRFSPDGPKFLGTPRGDGGSNGLGHWLALRHNRKFYQGKVVVITGASRGLGLEMARYVAQAGAKLAICARTNADIAKAKAELRRYGAEVMGETCDLASEAEASKFIRAVIDRWGRIDVLINNAGVIQVGPMDAMTLDDYRSAMGVHFWGPLYTIQAAYRSMPVDGQSRIVNITSIGGKISVPHLLPYSASKFALVGFSEGLGAELADRGIKVTTVCPGLMRTGSPRNAWFKGRHREEYAWFSISGSLPGVSMNSQRAARQILRACRRGQAEAILSLPAKLAVRLHGVFPGLTVRILQMVNRWLPSSDGAGREAYTGAQSFSRWSPSRLTRLNEQAAVRNHEIR